MDQGDHLKRSLFIKDKQWKIKVQDQVFDENNHECFGLCDYYRRTITIAKNQTDRELVDSLLHEILHALFHEYDIEMSAKKDEKVVRELTKLILHCFTLKVS